MTINLDQYTNTLNVTDTATNADLNLTTKGTGTLVANLNSGYFKAYRDSGTNTVQLRSNGNLGLYAEAGGAILFNTNTAGDVRQMQVAHTASAVNYVQVTGAATAGNPVISAQGSDTNIGLSFAAKNNGNSVFTGNNGTHFRIRTDIASASNFWEVFGSTGGPILRSTTTGGSIQTSGGTLAIQTDTSSTTQFAVSHTASAVNYVNVTGALTGASPNISAQGSDANIQIQLQAKGTGLVRFATGGGLQAYVSDTVSPVNYVSITGAATGVAVQLSALGSDTNIPLVLQPKGTGALQAQQTDSTATGGNARGANAVDWQTSRALNTQVASGGQSVIAGGQNNVSTGTWAVVSGGLQNTNTGTLSTVSGGYQNNASGYGSTISGGFQNTSAGWWNFIGNGQSNSGTANAAVTTQSATMNGTTAVTLSGSNASIKVGQLINGTSIANYTYVAAISGTSLTLSQAASGSSTSTLSFFTPHGVVVGGGNNQATGSYSFIGGGGNAGTASQRNLASGDWSFIGGGINGLASGIASVVCGGGTLGGTTISGNTASGTASFVGSGYQNTANSTYAVVINGQSNSATSGQATVLNGTGNVANSGFSTVINGQGGTSRGILSNTVIPSSNPLNSPTGASQSALLVLGRQTTDATATVLTCDQAAAGTTNQIILPNNSAYFFTGEVVAGVTGGGNTKGWTIEGVIKRGANAASTTLVGTTVTSMYADVGAATWTIAVTADTTNGGLAVTFTGQASTTIRTVCQIRTTEMTY